MRVANFRIGKRCYFGVPKLPASYDTFEWAVVSSFFLVHAVNLGKSNVASWLEKK
jgi:hypothetical protein